MNVERVGGHQLANFIRRFQFSGGVLRFVRIRNDRKSDGSVLLGIHVRDNTTSTMVRLKLLLTGIEEYRFQRRPVGGVVRLKEVRFGTFNGLTYLNLDAYPDDLAPQVMDFRASDAFVAGREMSFEVMQRNSKE